MHNNNLLTKGIVLYCGGRAAPLWRIRAISLTFQVTKHLHITGVFTHSFNKYLLNTISSHTHGIVKGLGHFDEQAGKLPALRASVPKREKDVSQHVNRQDTL